MSERLDAIEALLGRLDRERADPELRRAVLALRDAEAGGSPREDLAWLGDLIAAGADFPLHEPPASLSRSLLALFDGESPVRWEDAVGVHDSRSASQLVGVRGPRALSVWSLTFSAGSLDVVIDGTTNANGMSSTGGQILPLDGLLDVYRVQLRGPRAVAVTSDEVGQFELGQLPPGTYSFEAENGTRGVRLGFDTTGDKPASRDSP